MKTGVIDSFRDQYRFLSNFYLASVLLDGIEYLTVEHAFQAAKTLDCEERRLIQMTLSPGVAKKIGRTIKLRPNWDQMRVSVMATLVFQKFRRHADLARRLFETGNSYLVEGNYWHDNFWGNCECWKCSKTPGENHLGKILMFTRKNLRLELANEEVHEEIHRA